MNDGFSCKILKIKDDLVYNVNVYSISKNSMQCKIYLHKMYFVHKYQTIYFMFIILYPECSSQVGQLSLDNSLYELNTFL